MWNLKLLKSLGWISVLPTRRWFIAVKIDEKETPLFGLWRREEPNSSVLTEPWFGLENHVDEWSFLWTLRMGEDFSFFDFENRITQSTIQSACASAIDAHYSNMSDFELGMDLLAHRLQQKYGAKKCTQ